MAWRNILIVGVVASAAIVGCTVTAGTGGEPDASSGGTAAATGGTAGTGGTSSTGGTKSDASAGGTATGGTTSTGGTTAIIYDAAVACEKSSFSTTDSCDGCLKTDCCGEWTACVNEGAADADGNGNTCLGGSKPEFPCIRDCLLAPPTGDAGAHISNLVEYCFGRCSDNSQTLTDATNALFICATAVTADAGLQACSSRCYGGELVK